MRVVQIKRKLFLSFSFSANQNQTQNSKKPTPTGFARRLARGERASTLCGTPEYLAPELVAQAGHTRAVDWWALGVLVFEMAAGRPPFDGNGGSGSGSGGGGDRMAMFRDISKGKFSFPAHFSKELRDLVKKLLTVSAAARLGSGREGAAEVKAHPWFSGPVGSVASAASAGGNPNAAALPRFDWDALAARSIPAPFLPPTSTTARWTRTKKKKKKKKKKRRRRRRRKREGVEEEARGSATSPPGLSGTFKERERFCSYFAAAGVGKRAHKRDKERERAKMIILKKCHFFFLSIFLCNLFLFSLPIISFLFFFFFFLQSIQNRKNHTKQKSDQFFSFSLSKESSSCGCRRTEPRRPRRKRRGSPPSRPRSL